MCKQALQLQIPIFICVNEKKMNVSDVWNSEQVT